jgi:hypothetical protein
LDEYIRIKVATLAADQALGTTKKTVRTKRKASSETKDLSTTKDTTSQPVNKDKDNRSIKDEKDKLSTRDDQSTITTVSGHLIKQQKMTLDVSPYEAIIRSNSPDG